MRITALRITLISTLLPLGLWLIFGYFGLHTLFTDTVINEELPPTPRSEPVVIDSSNPGSTQVTSTTPTPRLVRRGTFTQGDSTYAIQGSVEVVEREDQRYLALRDFTVTNGPDLFVYLIETSSMQNTLIKDRVREKRYIRLEQLKGNQGNQLYHLPEDIDLSRYTTVSIWCERFARNFGSASLEELP